MIDQNEDRSKFVGGSEVAAIMGLSQYETPLSIWAKKTGNIPSEIEMNEAIEFGIELEDFVCNKFAERTGKTVTVDETTHRHPEYDYMVAHIDRRVDGGEVLEAKTASAYLAKAWEDDIPDAYYIQLNWYLGILGDSVGHIACLIGGQKFVYKEIKFDKALFDKCVETVRDFWENYVKTDVAPFAISGDKDTLIELFPESRPDSLMTIEDPDLELAFNQLAIDRMEGKDQIKAIDVEVDEADNRIRQMIGDGLGIESGIYKATWASSTRRSVDVQKLKDDGIYKDYLVETSVRTLRVLEKKSKQEGK